MLSAHLFDVVNLRLNQLLKSSSPTTTFGNLAVIAFGDFYQLSPVRGTSLLHYDPGALSPNVWNEFARFELTTIMRQKDDADFAMLLNRIRMRTKTENITENDDKVLQQRVCTKSSPDPSILHLYGTNKEVDDHNMTILSTFDNSLTLTAADMTQSARGTLTRETTPISFHASEGCMLPTTLTIALHCRVMVIANVDVPGN